MKTTIPHLIKHNADNYSDEIAIREKKFGVWRTKTWKNCYEEIQNISLGLMEKGIKEKKTIAIIGNNTPRWTLSEIAVQSLGVIPLGLYSDALESEIVYLLDYTDCRTVFVEDLIPTKFGVCASLIDAGLLSKNTFATAELIAII